MKSGVPLIPPITPWLYPSKISATAVKRLRTQRRAEPGTALHKARELIVLAGWNVLGKYNQHDVCGVKFSNCSGEGVWRSVWGTA